MTNVTFAQNSTILHKRNRKLKERVMKFIRKNKDSVHEIKEKAKDRAEKDPLNIAVCCDLEQMLQIPHALTSSSYYERKLSMYFTIFELGTKTLFATCGQEM